MFPARISASHANGRDECVDRQLYQRSNRRYNPKDKIHHQYKLLLHAIIYMYPAIPP